MAFEAELRAAREAAMCGGAEVLRHYRAGTWTKGKPDGSPLTQADLDSEAAIREVLARAFPDDAIRGEESGDERSETGRLWIVDPLDGTRDFVARTDDFAVCVGLSINGKAMVGAIYHPTEDALYEAAAETGAWRMRAGSRTRLNVSDRSEPAQFRVGVSRFVVPENLTAFLDGAGLGEVHQIGACIKMLAVAEARLDATFCLHSRENEWDTCAIDILIREAGGQITDVDGEPFTYGRPDVRLRRGIVISNGARHAALCAQARPFFQP